MTLITDKEQIAATLRNYHNGNLFKIRTVEWVSFAFFIKFEDNALYFVKANDYWKTGEKKITKIQLHRIKSIRDL